MLKNKSKLFKHNKEEDLVFTKHKIDDNNSLIEPDNESEVDFFEKPIISQDYNNEKKPKLADSEIEGHLREIYSDDDGESLPDFKTIKIKKKRSLGLKLLYLFVVLVVIAIASFSIFKYIKNNQDVASVLKITITSPEKVILGEDFLYEIEYQNTSNYNLDDVVLEVNYPDSFILAEIYSVDQTTDKKTWKIDSLGANLGGVIKIRGKIINKEGSNNLLTVKTSYGINGLSSSFSKDSLNSIVVGSLPFQIKEDYYSTVLVDEEYPLKLTIKDFPVDKINKFIISFSGPEEIFSVKDTTNKNTGTSSEATITKISKIDNFNFLIETSSINEMSFDFKYKISERKNDQENISWTLKYIDDGGKEFVFLEKQVALTIIKSDLNLNISVNDSSTDTPVNFGDTLNYVISYSNKGDKDMEDLVIMAVLKSDFLDWNSLKDSNDGSVSRRTISWTASEISELKKLEPGDGGEIKFSINVTNYNNIEFGQDLNVASYAQFSIGNIEDFSDEEDHLNDNSSNTVVNKLNSDLSIKEEVLYFDANNIPVGSGPLPPVVGEKTSFKYYWTLKNSLHELKDLKVELALPQYVIWDNNFNVSAGSLDYDPLTNKVIFSISRWPVGIETVDINFSVSIIPTDSQYNKIIILSSGSSLSAIDAETNATIIKTTDVKTSKLEDDVIASYSNDGRVK